MNKIEVMNKIKKFEEIRESLELELSECLNFYEKGKESYDLDNLIFLAREDDGEEMAQKTLKLLLGGSKELEKLDKDCEEYNVKFVKFISLSVKMFQVLKKLDDLYCCIRFVRRSLGKEWRDKESEKEDLKEIEELLDPIKIKVSDFKKQVQKYLKSAEAMKLLIESTFEPIE